jgi:thymidylate kinase
MLQTPTLETRATAQENPVALEAVAGLFQTLNRHGVRYCHWKSNLRLERGLLGQTDLDLLVDPDHSQMFKRILAELNVKPVLAAPGREYPAIEHYLGFDPASGKLFHLHVHYQLVLGEQFVKNYRLPLEAHVLDSIQLRHEVKIPTPELELIVLSLRALLKYRDRDVIKDVFSIRSPGLPDHIRNEIEWLLAQTSLERVAQTAKHVAAHVPAGVVLEFLHTFVHNPRAGYRLFRLRQRVRRALSAYQRGDRLQAVLKYFREAWRRRKLLRLSPIKNMTRPGGGVTLALVGADGSGNSTMCQKLARWLAWKLDVHIFYLGSKQPSRRSKSLYLLFRMARRSHRAVCGVLGERHILSHSFAAVRQSLLYSHCLSIAHDRYARVQAGRQQAAAGSIVIYDRYPLETISTRVEHRLLDGPNIPRIANGDNGSLTRAFARAEENLYRKIHPPDILCVLDVSPDVSLQRKPDHQRAVIEAKSRVVSELALLAQETVPLGSPDPWPDPPRPPPVLTGGAGGGPNVILIDANRPVEEVLSQLKTKVWEAL